MGERSRNTRRKTRKDGGEHPTSGEKEGALRLKKRTPLGGAGAIQRCPIPGWRRHEGQKVWVCFRAFSRENSKLLLLVYTKRKQHFKSMDLDWLLSKMPQQPSPEVPLHACASALVCARAPVAWQGRRHVISSSVKELFEQEEEETTPFPAG